MSTEAALHLVHEKIKSVWRKGEIATMVCFDVQGAFDNVALERLKNNLHDKDRSKGSRIRISMDAMTTNSA